ncbi:MAG: head GIN domain-containing protein [Flavobacteriales bacterium]
MKKVILIALVIGAWYFIFGNGGGIGHFWNADHVKGTGDVVHRPLAVDAFHGITLQGSMDVMITPSNEQSVEVVAQQNIADLVTTEVKNGVWNISTSDGFSTNEEFTINIKVPAMDKVKIQGSGDIEGTDSFKADQVDLKIEGSGDIKMTYEASSVKAKIEGSGDIVLKGSCADLDLAIEGSGDVDSRGLQCVNARTSIAGSGGIFVNATTTLDATIAGSGSVQYSGNPQLKKSVAGSGEVKKLD